MSTNTVEQSVYRCLIADKDSLGNVACQVISRDISALATGEVTVRVQYSSLNFKDALAATGHPGVAKSFPIVPGIDAAGVVIESQSSKFSAGDEVLIFHSRFGTEVDGGYAEFVRVPAAWVYALPRGLSALEAMSIGTGGFTAAQSVDELLRHGITPSSGEIIVTGATGGVGIFAVKLLHKLGYQVVASSGKTHLVDWLHHHGAARVVPRSEVDDSSDRPLLSAKWAGAIDTVGGNTLSTIVRSAKPYACVTACGVVGGAQLPLTVYPFILRGVTLQGIDSAGISREFRAEIWSRLAGHWRLEDIDKVSYVVKLDELTVEIARILRGEIAGRVVVDLQG